MVGHQIKSGRATGRSLMRQGSVHTCLMRDNTHEVLQVAKVAALYCTAEPATAGSESIITLAIVLAAIHPLPSVEGGVQEPKELLLAAFEAARSA